MNDEIAYGTYPRTFFPFEIEHDYTLTSNYVVGSPDMGKSTLLGNLAEQFCAQNEGVLLLDIKGDLAREVASRTRYPDRVIYVKMGEIPFPGNDVRMWTINPFDGHRTSPERRKQLAVSILESFERMGLAQLGVMANIRGTVRSAINLAMVLPDPTYLDILLIIISETYRKQILAQSRHVDHITRAHWEDMDQPKVTPRNQRFTQMQSSRNRLETLLDRSDFNLPAGSYSSTFQLKEWLDEGKMVIVDLGLPLVRETGIDLGNMVMAQVMTDVFLRPEHERTRPWRIIADEFHLFVGANFATIITDARSYNVFPVIAHQDRGQLPSHRDSPLLGALGHAGISLYLKGSREDRVALASLFGEAMVEEFFTLKRHSAIINYFSSLAGSYTHEGILLNDWWGDPVPGQLADLQMAARPFTVSKKELVEGNRRRYWDRLDAGRIRDTRGNNDPAPKPSQAKTSPPPSPPKRQGSRPAEGAGGTPDAPNGNGNPGGYRPARPADQRHDSGSAVPRPPKPRN